MRRFGPVALYNHLSSIATVATATNIGALINRNRVWGCGIL